MGKLKKWLLLDKQKKQLFIEALMISVITYCILLFVPFRRINKWLKKEEKHQKYSINSILEEKITWSISTAGNIMKWRNICLVNAITGKLMLSRRRINSKILYGVKKDEHDKLRAHAWLAVEDKILLGGTKDGYAIFKPPHHNQ